MAASNEALELLPQHHKALYRRGVIQTRLGLLDEAMADFKRLVALEPANVQVFPSLFFSPLRLWHVSSALLSSSLLTSRCLRGHRHGHGHRYREIVTWAMSDRKSVV